MRLLTSTSIIRGVIRIRERSKLRTTSRRRSRDPSNRNRDLNEQSQLRKRLHKKKLLKSLVKASRRYNTEVPVFHYDSMSEIHKSVVIGRIEKTCGYCITKKFNCEAPGLYCISSRVRSSALGVPPPLLFSYMTGKAPKLENFLLTIRYYNTYFQMASFELHLLMTLRHFAHSL